MEGTKKVTCPLTRINKLKKAGLTIPPALLDEHREYQKHHKRKSRAKVLIAEFKYTITMQPWQRLYD